MSIKEKSLEKYFRNSEEAQMASKIVEVFHDRFLIDESIGRKNVVLLGLYMLCNYNKVSFVSKEELKKFITEELNASIDFSKGLYDAKQSNEIIESDEKVGLTKKGLDAIRSLLKSGKE